MLSLKCNVSKWWRRMNPIRCLLFYSHFYPKSNKFGNCFTMNSQLPSSWKWDQFFTTCSWMLWRPMWLSKWSLMRLSPQVKSETRSLWVLSKKPPALNKVSLRAPKPFYILNVSPLMSWRQSWRLKESIDFASVSIILFFFFFQWEKVIFTIFET